MQPGVSEHPRRPVVLGGPRMIVPSGWSAQEYDSFSMIPKRIEKTKDVMLCDMCEWIYDESM
jgi:hypothetical protein